ncbi:MAG: hypothetical protein K1X72_02285 [Pyrinomonadaceae bacterium]|nr:hypothetical protein [Pyrinomonadaceae bacterium]
MSGKAAVIAGNIKKASRAEQQQPVKPVQSCPNKNWIELVYKYNSSRAVSGASYQVFDAQTNQSLASGCLNNMGFARVEGLPDSVSNVKFLFTSDPKDFELFPGFKPKPHNLTAESVEVKEENGTIISVAKWVGVALEGDFADDQSMGQIAFGTVVTMIPVVDQIGDVRDIIANLHRLTWRKQYDEFAPWFGLVLSLIGAIPELGSLIKGVVKELFAAAKRGLKKLPLAKLIKLLNSVGEGNVIKFLRELLSKIHGHGQDAAAKIFKILESMKAKLENLRHLAFGKAEKMIDRMLESISQVYRRVPEMVQKVIDQIFTHLKNTLDDVSDFVMKGVTRARNGAKQLREKFIRATGKELSALAEKVGMKPEHIEKLAAHCQKSERMVVVRASNTDALKFQGKAGHLPKPLEVKLKTAKGKDYAEEIRGLVVRPKEPMKDWERENMNYLLDHGYRFDEKTDVLLDKNGNVFYGDYDVQSVQSRVLMENPETQEMESVYVNEFSNPDDGVDVIADMNKDVVGDIPSSQRPFQHGAEGDFRVKVDEHGNVVKGADGKPILVKADDMNAGGKGGAQMKAGQDYKLGRQFGDDEKYLVVDADGNYRVAENPAELKKIYDEIGVPWEYDNSFATAPANAAAATGGK